MAGTADTRPRHALAAALQWGLVQAYLLDTVGQLLTNYYGTTAEAFAAPGWVSSIQFAVPLAFLVGAYGGYRWVTAEGGATTASAHRARLRSAGALLVGWALAVLPSVALRAVVEAPLVTVPTFLLPGATAVVVLAAAYWVGYRVSGAWYARNRGRLLHAAQGALAGLLVGFAGFVGYGAYLRATRASYSLDGTPSILAGALVGACIGTALADRFEPDRAAEFIVVLACGSATLALLSTVVSYAVVVVGILPGVMSIPLLPLAFPLLLLLLATYLTYVARTDLHRRLVGTA